MMRRMWPILLVALSAGCGQSSPNPSASVDAASPLPLGSSAREAAYALVQRGDWPGAVVKYREALREAPGDVQLHFALGSALSHLDRREEAVEQFRLVVARGRASLPEVAAARQWLREAGALDTQVEAASPSTASVAVDPRSSGSVVGKTTWPGVGGESVVLTLQVLLVPDEAGTKGKPLGARTRLGQPYAFASVPEGRYRLMAQVGPVRLWDAAVQVTAGKETVLDLAPETSPVSPRDFPQRAAGLKPAGS